MTQEYDFAIDPRIEALPNEELAELRDSLRELIPLRIDGIAYAESRRAQLASVGGAMLSVGIAVFPLSSLVAWEPGKLALVALGICAVLTGLTTWLVYVVQVNYPYPFVSEVKTWKWFYHQALPDSSAFGPTLPKLLLARLRRPKLAAARRVTEASTDFKREATAVTSQYKIYTEQVDGLSRARVDATQDLRQLYLLHLNELYKNKFLTQLRTVLSVGVTVATVVPVATLVAAIFFSSGGTETTASHSKSGLISSAASWAATGLTRTDGISSTDIQYRLTIRATNNGSAGVALTVLTALDDDQRPIPAEFSFRPAAARLSPGGTVQIVGYMWLPSGEAGRVAAVVVS